MKTAKQIFEDQFYFLRDFLNYKTTPARLEEIVIGCMEKYAEQFKAQPRGISPMEQFRKSTYTENEVRSIITQVKEKCAIGAEIDYYDYDSCRIDQQSIRDIDCEDLLK